MQRLLKPTEVADRLSVSRAWVYDAAKVGRIPAIRIGGQDGPLRFVAEDVERWLDQARAEWTPAPVASRPAPRRLSMPVHAHVGESVVHRRPVSRASYKAAGSRPRAVASASGPEGRVGDRFFGRNGAGGEHVALQVPVVALGRARCPHGRAGAARTSASFRRRARPQPRCGARSAAACPAGRRPAAHLVPLARDGVAVSGAGRPVLAHRPRSSFAVADRHHEHGAAFRVARVSISARRAS